jgi:hypothetical protein
MPALSTCGHISVYAANALAKAQSPRDFEKSIVPFLQFFDSLSGAPDMDDLEKTLEQFGNSTVANITKLFTSLEAYGDAYRIVYQIGRTADSVGELLALSGVGKKEYCRFSKKISVRTIERSKDFFVSDRESSTNRVRTGVLPKMGEATRKEYESSDISMKSLTPKEYERIAYLSQVKHAVYATKDPRQVADGFVIAKHKSYPETQPMWEELMAHRNVTINHAICNTAIEVRRIGLGRNFWDQDKMSILCRELIADVLRTGRPLEINLQ